MQAVILAGGLGTRLKPFTNSIPKPLVPLGEEPILEIILKQLRDAGVDEIIITVNHLANLIRTFFGDGKSLGLNIRYSEESIPLGTASPVKLVHGLDDNFIVMNGDILSTINFRELFDGHLASGAIASIATYEKEVKIDLGIVEYDAQSNFTNYIEKPMLQYKVSTGIYVFNKKILDFIPTNKKFDIPDLMKTVYKESNNKIFCYTGSYDWMDIGRVEDYEVAVDIFLKNPKKYRN